MDRWIALVALVATLFLIGRGFPARRLLVATAAALGIAVAVLWLESSGLWPRALTR